MKQGFIFAAEVGHSKVYLLIIKNKESSSQEINKSKQQSGSTCEASDWTGRGLSPFSTTSGCLGKTRGTNH